MRIFLKYYKYQLVCLLFVFFVSNLQSVKAQENDNYEFYCTSIVNELFDASRTIDLVNYFEVKYHGDVLSKQLDKIKVHLVKVKDKGNKVYLTKVENEEDLPLYNIFIYKEDSKKELYQLRIMFEGGDSYKMKKIVGYDLLDRHDEVIDKDISFPPLPPSRPR